MGTKELLVKQLQSELSFNEYNRHGKWFMNHIDRLVTEYPFLKIGASIKTNIGGDIIISQVERFIINCGGEDFGILVDTGYGNVYYYETSEPTKKD